MVDSDMILAEEEKRMAKSLYESAFEHFSPYNASQKLDCADLTVNSAITRRQSSKSIDAGSIVIRLTREALAEHPLDAAYYLTLNEMFNSLALHSNRDLAKDARAYGERALELSPKRQEAAVYLAQTYLILNESNRAIELGRRMLQDADFPKGRWILGLALFQNRQGDEAKGEIRKAIATGYQPTQNDISGLKGFLSEKEILELTAGK